MSDLISMDKQYRTRDGREVEVLRVDVNHKFYPIVIVVTNPDGSQFTSSRTPMGCEYYAGWDSPSDLIEVKPRVKRDVWFNIYPEGHLSSYHRSKEEANKFAGDSRIACIKVPIDYEHGEGL